MKSGDVVNAQPLMAMDQTTVMRMRKQKPLDSPTKTQQRKPPWARCDFTQLMNIDTGGLFNMAALTNHRHMMAQLRELARQLPNVTLHATNRPVTTHHVDQLKLGQSLNP